MSLISIARHLYRNRTFAVILLLVLVSSASAQKKPAKRGPRATAIIVMSSDGKTPKELIPVVIRDNEQFWDASIYQATPRPMALEPGIVYEVERSGEPIGLFIVRTPTNDHGVWAAKGKWQPPRSNTGPLSKLPVADPDVPVLRRTKPPEDDDPDRPKIHRSLPAPESPDQDPGRPEMKRGRPEASPTPSPSAPVATAAKPAPAPANTKPPELLAAVSDAAGPDPHSFLLDLKPDEQSKLHDAGVSLAHTAVLKNGALPANTRLEIKSPAVRYFDLDGNNSPEVVLNGIASIVASPAPKGAKAAIPATKDFYVTVIGKEDLSGEVHLVYSRVVSARNTEFDGRLELVDAVDVDGDGRGELLFRRLTGRDLSYLVLKVGMRQTTTLFDSSGR